MALAVAGSVWCARGRFFSLASRMVQPSRRSFYSNGASARFAERTNDTGEVDALAIRLGERLWRDDFRYSKQE